MNALAVGTPRAISSGSSATGSSCWPEITADRPKSTAASPSVRARNSSRPASSDARPRSLMPVPGLLKARKVVVPPKAAATLSW